jgi:hypothetical protein
VHRTRRYKTRKESQFGTRRGYGAGFSAQRRRSKLNWACIGPKDAFNQNIDHWSRLEAQRQFYRHARKEQKLAAQQTGASVDVDFEYAAKAQLSPFYTDYPASMAALASVGATAFLEYRTRTTTPMLYRRVRSEIERTLEREHADVDPSAYKKMATIATKAVETRLLLEELSRVPGLASIEAYRVFAASQLTLGFEHFSEIVQAVVLYGDLLPEWSRMRIHPMSFLILRRTEEASESSLLALPRTAPSKLATLGGDWVMKLCAVLADFLPRRARAGDDVGRHRPDESQDTSGIGQPQFSNQGGTPSPEDHIAPLDEPMPPAFGDSASPLGQLAESLASDAVDAADNPMDAEGAVTELENTAMVAETLGELCETLQDAGGQTSEIEDIRNDIVAEAIRCGTFGEGPIEGVPVGGHEVSLDLGGEQAEGGEVFDRSVDLSDDVTACEMLCEAAFPVEDSLRKILYPSIEQLMEPQRPMVSGTLDPSRLVLYQASNAVFKRYDVRDRNDTRGEPVLMIACDGSGSLNERQMRMTKMLATGWLGSTTRCGLRVMAGLYHSGEVRPGVNGPLVQWVFHPVKSLASNHADAVRALVTLPDDGTGVQSDALSLSFMVDEARRVAQGRTVYLILISDCEWNRSFHTEKSGEEEVRVLFEQLYDDMEEKFHTTLVALDVEGETGLEDVFDKIICVPGSNLEDPAAVAEQISTYVASCILERRRIAQQS